MKNCWENIFTLVLGFLVYLESFFLLSFQSFLTFFCLCNFVIQGFPGVNVLCWLYRVSLHNLFRLFLFYFILFYFILFYFCLIFLAENLNEWRKLFNPGSCERLTFVLEMAEHSVKVFKNKNIILDSWQKLQKIIFSWLAGNCWKRICRANKNYCGFVILFWAHKKDY